MVKLNWLEENAIVVFVAIVLFALFRFLGLSSWFWFIIGIILFWVMSSIVVKAIKGKDAEKKNIPSKTWWGRQKSWIKVIVIIVGIVLLSWLWLIDEEGQIKDNLESKGYEVSNLFCSNSNVHSSLVEMKSLGDRRDQIVYTLINLAMNCPPSDNFYITILEPTRECSYSFNGELIGLWELGITQDFPIPEESKKIIEADTKFILWKASAKYAYEQEIKNGILNTPIEQMGLSSAYKDYLQNGMTETTLSSMVYYEINNKLNCESL